jgi:uncharacterized membrane protein
MRFILKLTAVVAAVLYPVLVYGALRHFGASPRILVLLLAAVGTIYFLAHTDSVRKGGFRRMRVVVTVLIVAVLALLTLITGNTRFVKLYPVLINMLLLLSFSYTLIKAPPMIFRFALLQDRSIAESPDQEMIEAYCRNVTVVWVVFFGLNGLIAASTALFASAELWTIYNGFISYLLIGLILGIEWIVRKRKMKS